MDASGIVTKQSQFSVKETIDRLETLLIEKGVTIYARIDQQHEALKAGLTLHPIELLVFGNPKAGVPIMAANPLAAIDLPIKALAWQDGDNKVWLSHNTHGYIQQRFGLPDDLAQKINVAALVEQAL
jgi:uncharacterized protein (DUF302 family)